jgi:hypothetical protein
MIISAGMGYYNVCPDIALPTRRRVLQTGVSTRIVSLNHPPEYASATKNSAVFFYKCFPSDHKRNAEYDPFKTKEESIDNKLLFSHQDNETRQRNLDLFQQMNNSFVNLPASSKRKVAGKS